MVDPTKCQIFGPGVERGNVGTPAKFTVQTVNRFGTPITEGGAPLHLTVQGPVDGANPRGQKVEVDCFFFFFLFDVDFVFFVVF